MKRIMSKKKFPDEAELQCISDIVSDYSGCVEYIAGENFDSAFISFDSMGYSLVIDVPFGNSFKDFAKNCCKAADTLNVEEISKVLEPPSDSDFTACEDDAVEFKEELAGFLKDVASDIEKRFVKNKAKNTAKCR